MKTVKVGRSAKSKPSHEGVTTEAGYFPFDSEVELREADYAKLDVELLEEYGYSVEVADGKADDPEPDAPESDAPAGPNPEGTGKSRSR